MYMNLKELCKGGSNTDSGSKRGVYAWLGTILYIVPWITTI